MQEKKIKAHAAVGFLLTASNAAISDKPLPVAGRFLRLHSLVLAKPHGSVRKIPPICQTKYVCCLMNGGKDLDFKLT